MYFISKTINCSDEILRAIAFSEEMNIFVFFNYKLFSNPTMMA